MEDEVHQCFVTNSLFFMHSISVWNRWMASLWLKLKVFLIVAMMSASTPSGSPLKGNHQYTPSQTVNALRTMKPEKKHASTLTAHVLCRTE